jgi:hypothetical protein
MAMSPEVKAAIIRVSGDWALAMAKANNNDKMPLYFKEAFLAIARMVGTRE